MRQASVHITSPDAVAAHLGEGPLQGALSAVAALADAELSVGTGSDGETAAQPDAPSRAITYRGESLGNVRYEATGTDQRVPQAASAIAATLDHMVSREIAINDMAEALMTGYEELDMLYSLLPAFATQIHPNLIGEVLVEETARMLGCKRVSLLVLDENRERFVVLASRGLPDHLRNVAIPLHEPAAPHALSDDDLLVVNSMTDRASAPAASAGEYGGDTFAVARVPLKARGEALGCLTVTERVDGGEFTARDLKLLDGLAAMGASALLGCQLHATLNKQMMSTIQALASAVEAKDHYTHDHAGRVAELCVETARRLGVVDTAELRKIELAGLLHDIGKIGVPDAILGKAGKLTPEEFATIQTHVRTGAEIVGHVPGLDDVARAILHHHERYDGLGYLMGLSGDSIPLASRLISVTDTFDSMTTDRPYRKAVGAEEALSEISRCSGTQFDPEVADAFAGIIESTETGAAFAEAVT